MGKERLDISLQSFPSPPRSTDPITRITAHRTVCSVFHCGRALLGKRAAKNRDGQGLVRGALQCQCHSSCRLQCLVVLLLVAVSLAHLPMRCSKTLKDNGNQAPPLQSRLQGLKDRRFARERRGRTSSAISIVNKPLSLPPGCNNSHPAYEFQ